MLLVGLFVTLIHEGGHLFAALWTGQERVSLRIGTFGQLIDQRLGSVRMNVALATAPWRSGGEVSFDAARTTARQMLGIALAGPAASLVGAAATAWIAASTDSTAVSEFFAWATVAGVLAVILTLIPMTLTEGTRHRPGARVKSDGGHALDALRVLVDLRR
jgi:hypothetical protein